VSSADQVLSGQKIAAYELPVIDEEYLEAAAVYESVLTARDNHYSIVEVCQMRASGCASTTN
jgi:hypothetical protein